LISYDIEAFHPDLDNIIPQYNNGGIISMICASFTYPNDSEIIRVYILDQYKYNEEQIVQAFIDRRTEAKHPNPS
jgi:hypothetical protein